MMPSPDTFPVPLIHINETNSTNNYLQSLCSKQKMEELTVVVADFQTSGRGQRGNSWESDPGKNLLFSTVIFPEFLEARRQFLISQVISLAIKEEPNLYQLAWDKRVVLVTPSTLLATLKTVGSIWKQDRQNRHALEIAEQAGKLYDKFAGFIDDMERIGSKQKEATNAFDAAMNKLSTGNGNIIRSAEKLKEMGAKAKKTLDRKYNDLNQNSVHEVDENQ